jgi:autotransporter-associated beta strand protein
MKPTIPHDPFDDLIVAALHGELTLEERTLFDARLNHDAAAQAAYQQAKLMHDLLEKTHTNAQPDPSFEQRMVSGVRRKIQHEEKRETAWESALILWRGLTRLPKRFRFAEVAVVLAIVAILAGVALGPITSGIEKSKESEALQRAHQAAVADYQAQVDAGVPNPVMKSVKALRDGTIVAYTDTTDAKVEESAMPRNLDDLDANQKAIQDKISVSNGAMVALQGGNTYTGGTTVNAGTLTVNRNGYRTDGAASAATVANNGSFTAGLPMPPAAPIHAPASSPVPVPAATSAPSQTLAFNEPDATGLDRRDMADKDQLKQRQVAVESTFDSLKKESNAKTVAANDLAALPSRAPADAPTPANAAQPAAAEAPAIDTRKLIRNAQLDLEVKNYQAAVDAITALTKSAGGYVDTSNSQKGGNGKLQGTVVVKVLPQNLDAFLLKLRDLGDLQNQSVSTDDVTKDYFDTQARLENSRRMETQLQDLLKKTNGRVSDLLQVERELGRVRGDIEQMQGQLKLYDFQVQFATITIQMREKDLNQTAAYLLKEQDQFSLFASDVEGTFQEARHTADQFKAQILTADLNHESGSNVSAELTIMVAPDQIEAFLTQLRGLGRVANFTRQTQRVAKDGGDSDQPADQTLTEKDKVQVGITIRSDDESRKQVALTVVAPAVDTALDEAKTAALANPGAEILSSSLNKTTQGQSSAQLSVRVPGKYYHQLLDAYRALGRPASFSLQRDDNSGPGANGDDAPVIVSLSLTDTDTPLQVTQISVLGTDVDSQAQHLKKDAADAGVQVTGSNFQRDPNGMEIAQMMFRMPMAKYPTFVETLKKLGHVESLTVQRQDRPDQTSSDDSAPVEVGLRLHNQGDIVSEDTGFWATLRQTFGEGTGALFGSIRVIGVLVAFAVPWIVAIAVIAWVGRRIYIWKKK